MDPWSSTEKQKGRKVEREAEAERQLAEEFVEFQELTNCLKKYHLRADDESRFVYALDKIQPVVNIYLDGGDFYRTHRVTLRAWIEHNQPKVSESKHVLPYFEAMISLLATLETGSGHLFHHA